MRSKPLYYAVILNKLSRITSSSAVIKEVDGLRFIAIMPVIMLHLSTGYLRATNIEDTVKLDNILLYQVLQKGALGVNIFFVISGFILALPFASHYISGTKKVDIKGFYLRRLTRLEPPYIISLLVFFFALAFINNQYDIVELSKSLGASIIYSHFFIYGKWSIINPVTWSLETEVQFYLLAPAIFFLFIVRDWRIRLLVILFISLSLALVKVNFNEILRAYHLGKSLVVYAPYFLTGMLLADFYIRDGAFFRMERKYFLWDLAGIGGLIGTYTMHHQSAWYAMPMQSAFIALIFVAAFKGRILNIFFTKKEIVVIGGMCYSLYLLHYGIITFVMPLTSGVFVGTEFTANLLVQAALVLPIVLLISSLFFYFFERPFMNKNWYQAFPREYFKSLN